MKGSDSKMQPIPEEPQCATPVYVCWEEGYDLEWEFTVTVYDNFIHWHLQFDTQWAGAPMDEYQTFEDFLSRGAHSRFADHVDEFRKEEITKAVHQKMVVPDYEPFQGQFEEPEEEPQPGAHELAPEPEEVAPVPADMKTAWENRRDGKLYYCNLTPDGLVIGSSNSDGRNDNATACSYEDFLSGRHRDLVDDFFGREKRREIISYVKKAVTYPPFVEERLKTGARQDFVKTIPSDPSIRNMINSHNIINGNHYYGNAGGYNTQLLTSEYHFMVDCADLNHMKGSITHRATGEVYDFPLAGCCVSVVELNGFFYLVVNDNFEVIASDGRLHFNTAILLDAKQEPVFGGELRVMRTLRYETTILVQCRWLSGNCGELILKFDPIQNGFSGRWEEP